MTSNGQRFRRRSLRRGYKVDEVDVFLDRVEATLNGERLEQPVRAQDVHDVVFRVGFGGYDEWQVDLHLDRVERQLAEMEPGDSFVPDRMAQDRLAQERLAQERYAQDRMPDRGLPDRGMPDRSLPDRGLPERGMADRGMPERGMPERLPERMPVDRGPERMPPMPERMPERPGERLAPQMDRSMMGMPTAGGPPPGPVPLPNRPAPGPGGPGGPGPDRQAAPTGNFPRYDEGTYGGDPGYDNPVAYQPPPGYRQAPGTGFPPPPYRGQDPYEADPGGYPTSQYPQTSPTYHPEPPPRFPSSPPGPEYGGGPGYPGRGYEDTGRQPRMDMTTEMPARSPEPPPGPPGPPPPAGPSMPAGDLQRVDQLRRTFQPRRFGSGYDRAEVDQLFEGILNAMSGRSSRPIGPDDLDEIRFNLVPGGYYEDEVDSALREVRDILGNRR